MLRRKTLLVALALATAWYGWGRLAEQIEVVTLFVPGVGVQDHYTRLWVVDDPPFVWIRAERPDRLWIDSVRAHPDVTLWRGGAKRHYLAEIREDAGAYVDALFERKYGLVDRARGLLGRHSVPIRLSQR